jgi:hypothetical protein
MWYVDLDSVRYILLWHIAIGRVCSIGSQGELVTSMWRHDNKLREDDWGGVCTSEIPLFIIEYSLEYVYISIRLMGYGIVCHSYRTSIL